MIYSYIYIYIYIYINQIIKINYLSKLLFYLDILTPYCYDILSFTDEIAFSK